jgi:hypothetical protein
MGSYDRYNLPDYNRFDILKYTIASYASLAPRWTVAYFYIQLDSNYASEYDNLAKYIRELFSCPIHIFQHRNVAWKDWQKAARLILDLGVDDNIFWMNNHDHPCILHRNNVKIIDHIDKVLKEDKSYPEVLSYVSHFIEVVNSGGRNAQYIDENCCSIMWNNTDSDQIITQKTLETWWFKRDLNIDMIKSDFIQNHVHDHYKCIVPFQEICRHFDSSPHVANISNTTPPLTIPEGFFNNQMKISYCGAERKTGWTLVNPMLNFYASDKNGADYRNMIDELPLFWKDHIVEIDDSNVKNYSQDDIIKARNDLYINTVNPPMRIGGSGPWSNNANLPRDWFKAWLR